MAPAVPCSVLFGCLGLDRPADDLCEAGAASRFALRDASEIGRAISARRKQRHGPPVEVEAPYRSWSRRRPSGRRDRRFLSVRPNR